MGYPVLVITIEEASLNEVLRAAKKLEGQIKEKYTLEVKVEWKKSSPVEVIITILKWVVTPTPSDVILAAIWALIALFLLEVGKHVIKKRKNLQMASLQAWSYLEDVAKIDTTNLTHIKAEPRAEGNFWLSFVNSDKRYQLTISESCNVKKYEVMKAR